LGGVFGDFRQIKDMGLEISVFFKYLEKKLFFNTQNCSLYTKIRAVGLITCKTVEMLTCKLSSKYTLLLIESVSMSKGSCD
jgi:hypothetical protein